AGQPPAAAPTTEPTAPPPPVDPPPPAKNPVAESIDALFVDAAAKDAFSGSVVVVDGGKQVLAKGYGNADRDAKTPATADTVFRIGSVSKQFCATAILALVNDKKLALTDPVSKF